jgi:hypothetical protein
LTKTYEKYAHLVTPSNGLTDNYFLLIPFKFFYSYELEFDSTKTFLSCLRGCTGFFPLFYGAFFISP